MKKLLLFEKEQALGAVFSKYDGCQLPKYYSDIATEYQAARHAVAIMDRSHYGKLKISGKDCVDLLHRITTNELRNLKPGEGQINLFPTEKGRIVERVVLLRFADYILLITSPGTQETVANWIDKYTFIEDVKVEDVTSELGMLYLFGPESPELLNALFKDDFGQIEDRHFKNVFLNDSPVTVTRNDELCLPGYDLIVENEYVGRLWDALHQKGVRFASKPVGMAAYEILRIEAGWPLFAWDYDENVNPHEAQMRAYINFNKGCYIGQEVIARLDTYEKVQKYLMGIVLDGDIVPRHDDAILMQDNEVGRVTSATHSLALDKNVALGYVRSKFIAGKADVSVISGGRLVHGQLVELPFPISEMK